MGINQEVETWSVNEKSEVKGGGFIDRMNIVTKVDS